MDIDFFVVLMIKLFHSLILAQTEVGENCGCMCDVMVCATE
jgi:hypothetical protein